MHIVARAKSLENGITRTSWAMAATRIDVRCFVVMRSQRGSGARRVR